MLKIVALICLLIGLTLCDNTVTLSCASCSGGICLTLDGGGFSQYSVRLTQYSSCSAYSGGASFPIQYHFICDGSC